MTRVQASKHMFKRNIQNKLEFAWGQLCFTVMDMIIQLAGVLINYDQRSGTEVRTKSSGGDLQAFLRFQFRRGACCSVQKNSQRMRVCFFLLGSFALLPATPSACWLGTGKPNALIPEVAIAAGDGVHLESFKNVLLHAGLLGLSVRAFSSE